MTDDGRRNGNKKEKLTKQNSERENNDDNEIPASREDVGLLRDDLASRAFVEIRTQTRGSAHAGHI